MRYLAFILAFVMLFLSVQPALALLNEPQESECAGGCCHDEDETPADDKPVDPCGGQCNPMLTCSTCGSYLPDLPSYNFAVALDYIEMSFPISQKVHSQFSPEFWQPPKLV